MSEIAEPMSDNAALRSILAEVRAIQCELLAGYTEITGANSVAITDSTPYTRAANEDVRKTLITNLGPDQILIKEGAVLVGIKAQYETWSSALAGAEIIEVSVATGDTATIAIANYIK